MLELILEVTTFLTRWVPPVIVFGGPAQREKNPGESFWHLSVSMKPMISKFVGKSKLEECEIFMDVYDGDRVSDKIRLVFGDMYSEKPSDTITMVYGKRVFIPIAFRSDSGNDQNAYIATQRYFNKDEKDKPLQPDRRKHRFKLRLKSGGFERTTEHFYFIRVPNERRNSQFSVEQELFGDGTQGLKDDST